MNHNAKSARRAFQKTFILKKESSYFVYLCIFFYLQVQLQCSLARLPKQQTLAPVLAQRNSNLQLPYSGKNNSRPDRCLVLEMKIHSTDFSWRLYSWIIISVYLFKSSCKSGSSFSYCMLQVTAKLFFFVSLFNLISQLHTSSDADSYATINHWSYELHLSWITLGD